MQAAFDEIQMAQEDVDFNVSVEQRMSLQYDAGMVSVAELLKAQADLRQSRNQLTDAKINYEKALLRYQRRTGVKQD